MAAWMHVVALACLSTEGILVVLPCYSKMHAYLDVTAVRTAHCIHIMHPLNAR